MAKRAQAEKAKARKTRDDWIAAGTRALAAGGLAAVRVEVLARRLGVTKGSFYWHFDNRDALLTAMLEAWEARQTLAIIERVEATGGDAVDRLNELSRLTDVEGDADHEVEMALRDAARHDAAVGAFVQRVDEQRMAFLRGLYADLGCGPAEAEARSLMSYSLLIGDALIRADRVADRADIQRACRDLLFVPPVSTDSA